MIPGLTMKNSLFLCILLQLTFAPASMQAQTAAFTYQGQLLDRGQPANGNYDLRFTLADAASNGNYVAGPLSNAPVLVSDGLFAVTLDFGTSVFDGSARWLQIGVRTNGSVGPYTLLSPRQAITVTPYAAFANSATTATVAASLTPGAVITINGAGITNLNGGSIQAGTLSSNAFNAATSNNFARIGMAVTKINSVVNAEDFGAMHDGRQLVGNITSNSALVTLTRGSISASDQGSHVRVRFGLAANMDCVGTIATVTSSSSFTLSKVCSNTLLGSDITIAKTDDSPHLQAAVDNLAAGGGTIVCPPGIYWLGSPVYFDPVSEDAAWAPCVNIQGVNRGQFNVAGLWGADNTPLPGSLTVFWSGQEVGDGSALFSAPNWHNGGISFANILFRLPTDPNGIGVDGQNFASLITTLCAWDTGSFCEHDARIPRPTHASIAVRYPRNGNFGGGTSRLEGGVVCGGFDRGVIFSEHFNASGLAVLNCVNALSPNVSGQSVLTEVCIEGCLNPISGTNDSYGSSFIIQDLHVENNYSNWWGNGVAPVKLIEDPQNRLSGAIYMDTSITLYTNNGGVYVDVISYRQNAPSETDFRGDVKMGSTELPSSAQFSGTSEILCVTTNQHPTLWIKPASDAGGQSADIWLSPERTITASTVSLDINVPSSQDAIYFFAQKGGGGASTGVPFRFYPIRNGIGPLGYALSINTDGTLEVNDSIVSSAAASFTVNTCSPPNNPNTPVSWIMITNKANGAMFKMPLYQ
jgi:hypothetical protein